jgi:predicted nicotinamide N-methyase
MPGYLTKQECIAIAGAASLQIQSLLDKQQFSDPLGAAQRLGISSATWPLFGLLWPSGTHLAARMAAHVLQPGQRILEVGCGLGLASLVGHRRGADMTASDCHPLAAQFLATNLLLNALPPMKYQVGEWDQALTQAAGAPLDHAQRYELIIGSDVLYDRDASQALAGFIDRHATPSCEVWIVDPERGNRPAFSRRLEDLGFVTSQTRLDSAATVDAVAYRGRMLTYRRNDPSGGLGHLGSTGGTGAHGTQAMAT